MADDLRDIGLIGAGAMGRGMAKALARAGFRVNVDDIDPAALAALDGIPNVRTGAPLAAAACAVVISMLPSERATESVATSLGEKMPQNGVHLMMATIGPELAGNLQAMHEAKAQRFVAAPVFGRPDEAAAGDLTIAAGGAIDAALMQVLRAMGPRVHTFAQPQQACIVKLAGNGLIGAAIAALAESFALVTAQGIDTKAFHEIVTAKLFQGPVYRGVGTMMATDEIDPPNKFAAALAHKDLSLLARSHALAGTRAPVSAEVLTLLQQAIDAGYASADWSVLARLARVNSRPT